MVFPGLQTLVATVQNIVQAVNALATFLRKALNNVPGASVLGNPEAEDGTLVSMSALAVWQLLLANTGSEITLADADPVTPDFGLGPNFVLQLTDAIGATRLLADPLRATVGQTGFFRVIESPSGGNAVTFGPAYQAAGGVGSLALSTTADAVNLLLYNVVAGPAIVLSVLSDVGH